MTALDLSRSKLINCLFFSLGFGISKQYGGPSRKIWKFQGVGGLEWKIQWGGGLNWQKKTKQNLHGGVYVYFLDPHNMKLSLC